MGKFWGKLVEKIRRPFHSSVFPKTIPNFPQLFHKKIFPKIRRDFGFSTTKLPPLLILIFSFILVLFPNNLAKHFELAQSYVLGIKVDYLIPTFYLTEILVLLLLVLSVRRLRRRKLAPPQKLLLGLSGLFLVSLLPSVWRGSFDLIGIWRWLELALWLGFGFWVAVFVSERERRGLSLLLGVAVLWVSLLAVGQFLAQRSLFGYWFLGEPVLAPSQGGVALGSWGGSQVLRAYGTFPHPNVLGGVLSVLLVWLAARRLWPLFGAGLGALVFSLSKTAWVSLAGGLTATLMGLRSLLFWSDLSVSRRLELLESAGRMVAQSPLTGVGLGRFVTALPEFGVPSGLALFLQPAHNIFALVAAESGVLALAAFGGLLFFALRETIRRKRWWLTVALVQLVFLGLFDHYLYTLPQGLFLLFLIIGLSFGYADS